MNTILLLLGLAMAAETLPSDAAPDLGYTPPTVTEHGWRAGLPGGGLVKVLTAPDLTTAQQHFAWQHRTAQSGVWPEAATDLDVDEVAGDGTTSLLVRKGTVVIYVRSLSQDARSEVDQLLTRLQPSD